MGQTGHLLKADDRVAVVIASMAERIALSTHHFDFKALHIITGEPWDIWNAVTPVQPLESEIGPITTSEAAHHLMILGACAAALQPHQGELACFLPVQAKWATHCQSKASSPVATLTARARVVGRTPKIVETETEILADNEVIGGLWVAYQVFAEPALRQVFSRYHDAQPEANGFPLRVVFVGHNELVACSSDYSVGQGGRLAGCGLWSIASILYGLSQAIDRLLEHEREGPVRYNVLYADIQAVRLLPANEQLFFFANQLSPTDDEGVCDLSCSVTHSTGVVAIFRAVLQIH